MLLKLWIKISGLAIISLLLRSEFLAQSEQPFKMLVVGDSHISGQGLREENRSYSVVKERLEKELLGSSRRVELKVKAHAGSRITIHPEELKAMADAGDDINVFRFTEANLSAPSIRRQVEVAATEYTDPDEVDLVMLSGCITDVLVADIMSPFYPRSKLRERVRRFCNVSMTELLETIAATFPRAKIVVVGYAPIASRKTDIKAMARYFFKIVSFPPKLQFVATNPLSRQLLKPFRNKFAERSELWMRESNRNITDAVNTVNNRLHAERVFYVPSPIASEHSYGAPDTLVWEIGKDHRPNDETYAERKAGCAQVFAEMTYRHYGCLSKRMCELSSVAHPNVAGSRAFASAIVETLRSNVMPTVGPQKQ